MNGYVLSPTAERDLVRIWDRIVEDGSREAADRVAGELQNAMRKIARMPEMGHLREDLAKKPIRFWSVYSYLIAYRANPQQVQIIRVLHAARDVERLLGETDTE